MNNIITNLSYNDIINLVYIITHNKYTNKISYINSNNNSVL